MQRVLIVEDEALEREFLVSLAESMKNEEQVIISCATGDQAVSLAEKYRPELILMDILIPEKDGLTALKEIRAFLPQAHVIILSAFSEFSYAQQAIDLNVDKYLLKPVKPRELTELLATYLTNQASENHTETPATKEMVDPLEKINMDHLQDFIKEALQYIQQHFKEKITLENVAAHVYMNPQYFSRVFKKELGLSYTDYVNILRIEYACSLLVKSDYPSYRISTECGFNDPSYFNRVFFKQMQTTPNKYRKSVDNRK